MSDFTFLTEEQYFGNDKLEILEKRGTKAAITDFSVLLGGCVSDYHVDNDSYLEGRTGWYWTKSDDGDNCARVLYRSHQSAQSPRTERVGKEGEMVSLK